MSSYSDTIITIGIVGLVTWPIWLPLTIAVAPIALVATGCVTAYNKIKGDNNDLDGQH